MASSIIATTSSSSSLNGVSRPSISVGRGVSSRQTSASPSYRFFTQRCRAPSVKLRSTTIPSAAGSGNNNKPSADEDDESSSLNGATPPQQRKSEPSSELPIPRVIASSSVIIGEPDGIVTSKAAVVGAGNSPPGSAAAAGGSTSSLGDSSEALQVPLVTRPSVLPQHAFEGVHALKKGILTVLCPDSAGIIGTVTSFLHMHGANIVDCQTNSTPGNTFTLRIEFCIPEHWLDVVREAFAVMIAEPYGMQWGLKWDDELRKMAVLCTKEDHALMEMLWSTARKDLRCTINAVVSNHTDLQQATESLGFKFHHVPVEKGSKPKAEEEMLEIIKGADLVVLARYMQVLSPEFIDAVGVPIVNIHHSFLPAFKGANPYRQAHEKGVRLIGATAHYVTAELDQGPIIEQDVARVNHRMSVQDFRAMGRSVECKVLHRAVKWHLEDRVFLVDGNKTVVFS